MQASFIAVLITAIVFSIFAILNAKPVTINLLFASYELSQAIVILVSASLGALLMFLLNIVQNMKLKKEIKNLNNQLTSTMNNYMNLVNSNQSAVNAEQNVVNNNQSTANNSQIDPNYLASQMPNSDIFQPKDVDLTMDETKGME